MQFTKDLPFDEATLTIEVSLDKLQIIKASAAKIFGKIVTELVAKNELLDNLVVNEFNENLKKYLTTLTTEEQATTQTIAFKNEKNEIWVLDCTGKKSATTYTLVFKDKTFATAQLLGKSGGNSPVTEKTLNKKPVDLIFFKYTSINDKDIKRWVTKTATLLTKVGLWPAENRTKFIALRYEDDPKEKADFNHPFIDDLICLPFDRLIFLQKSEIVLNLPKKKSPSFLFVQTANDNIEMAKKVTIEQINDLGFAIANPVPLSAGTVGHIYFRFPGQKPLLDIHGKSHSSKAHPEKEGQYLTQFNYFGLSKGTNKEIRNYLARDTGYKNLINQNPSDFHYNPDSIFLNDEQKRKKTVAILDTDDSVIKNTVDYIKGEIHNIDIVSDDSYYSFFKKYLERRADNQKAQPAEREEFYTDIVSILVNSADLNLQMVITPPAETDLFLGHEIKNAFSEPQGWLKLFDEDSKNLLSECLYLVLTTKRVHKNMELLNAAGEKRLVNIEFILEELSSTVRLNFKPAEVKQQTRSHQLARIDSLECIIIDYALLPEDISNFIAGISAALQKNGIQTGLAGIRVIVTANDIQKIKFDKLLESPIYALVYKPLEIRRILYLLTQSLETSFSVYAEENIGWKTDNISAKISRPAKIVELSEFGAVLQTPQQLKPGTMLYLFQSIFQNAPDQNICVRVYHSEENKDEPGTYLNSVVYFGIADSFLKFTRSYIRETYASKKSKES